MAKSKNDEKEDGILTDEQIEEYREAFSVFDKNGDGNISCAELKAVLVSLGKDHTDEEVQDMIQSVDTDKSGTIEFNEFIMLMERETRSFESEDMIRQAFEMFDTEGDGYITLRKLKQVIQDLGCKFTEEEIDEMMELADEDGDGKVEYEGLIMLMSETNETLFSAYKKRKRRDEKAAIEMAKRLPVDEEEEPEEPPLTPDMADRIPAMEDIASQYESEVYDQYSRKVVAGRTVVKKPGKKVEMSNTRRKYLERKNKSLQIDTPLPEISTSGHSTGNGTLTARGGTTRDVAIREVAQASSKTPDRIGQSPRPSPMTEMWLGTIHDEREVFSTKFVARPPKRYRHVGSRLKDPNYYLKKDRNSRRSSEETFTNDKNDMDSRRSKSEMRKTGKPESIKDIRNQKRQKLEITRSAENTRTVGVSSVPDAYRSPRRQPGAEAYSNLYRRQNMEKMYYAVWRTAFTNALEKLRENKLRKILLQTPDLIAEHEEKVKQAQKKPQSKTKQSVKRMAIVKPTLHADAQKPIVETPEPTKSSVAVSASKQGSYTQKFRKRVGIESPRSSRVHLENGKGKTSGKQQQPPPMNLIEHRADVITKSGLNRMLNVDI